MITITSIFKFLIYKGDWQVSILWVVFYEIIYILSFSVLDAYLFWEI